MNRRYYLLKVENKEGTVTNYMKLLRFTVEEAEFHESSECRCNNSSALIKI